jgi:hypothetical protein
MTTIARAARMTSFVGHVTSGAVFPAPSLRSIA